MTAVRCVPEDGSRGYCADSTGLTLCQGAKASELVCTACPAVVDEGLRISNSDLYFRCKTPGLGGQANAKPAAATPAPTDLPPAPAVTSTVPTGASSPPTDPSLSPADPSLAPADTSPLPADPTAITAGLTSGTLLQRGDSLLRLAGPRAASRHWAGVARRHGALQGVDLLQPLY
jgi:hypothetical protein